jgi:uncharacterized protein (DUF1697 family)
MPITAFVALLRAVNVGGTGKLPMQALKTMCEKLGFAKVQTYIASGNVIFQSAKSEKAVKAALEGALQAYAGKPVGVMVRTVAEIEKVLLANPFPNSPPNKTVAIFLDESPPKDTLKTITGSTGEEVRLGLREIYVHYPESVSMARSKLKMPAAKNGTARNMNTVAKLAKLAAEL